jgi:peptide/nickel transport system substrate-binding protein
VLEPQRPPSDLRACRSPSSCAAEIKNSGAYQVVGTPVENSLQYVGLVTKMKPFDDLQVRQASAWAVPYEEIYKNVVYDICIPMSVGRGRSLSLQVRHLG